MWPANTVSGPKRTVEETKTAAQKIEDKKNGIIEDNINPEQLKGITGRSLLLNYGQFHFINDIPVRIRTTTRRLTQPAAYNALIKEIKCPREFSRRSRNLDLSVMKGQEMRNVILFFFPLIIKTIENQAKEREIWLLLALSLIHI